MAQHAAVIGAGLGGMAAACLLARSGMDVSVFEMNDTPGGKMQEIRSAGFRFDTGPSLLTMPFILEKLFCECGADLRDYLVLTEPDPLCRYFYRDGTVFDSFTDRNRSIDSIRRFAPYDADGYSDFLDHAESLYQKTAEAFLFNPLWEWNDLSRLNLADVLKINAFSTVSRDVDRFVESPYLRQFFKRFTTYNGSSPFRAPATLNVIPHVELNQGGYYVQGGLYRIAEAIHQLARTLGVAFHFGERVSRLQALRGSVTELVLENGSVIPADLVIANSDATETITRLLPDDVISSPQKKRQQELEPSCSGFVMLLGCDRTWSGLSHHNIFFSENYPQEFEDIFSNHKLPDDPTIYIANTSVSNPDDAPAGGSNLFILVNAPYVKGQNWTELKNTYSRFIIGELEKRGLNRLSESIRFKKILTPADFLKNYGSNRGSIYGTSSNGLFSAFVRPRNKLRELENLYLVGGSTHPGGGIPLVIQSAFHADELIQRFGKPGISRPVVPGDPEA